MRLEKIFTSPFLGNSPAESLKNAKAGFIVDPTSSSINFAITAIFVAETDNDNADAKFYLVSPKGKTAHTSFVNHVEIGKKGDSIAIGINVNMPLTDGAGVYSYKLDLGGKNSNDILFSIQHSQINAMTQPA